MVATADVNENAPQVFQDREKYMAMYRIEKCAARLEAFDSW